MPRALTLKSLRPPEPYVGTEGTEGGPPRLRAGPRVPSRRPSPGESPPGRDAPRHDPGHIPRLPV
ncbi:MAG: hypothetical protein DRO06_03100 [Thermoproteota archaeon]|nr:MAG: hypothetical protein DRO06_03100 [Candidatus Korarchaeota archaeon]